MIIVIDTNVLIAAIAPKSPYNSIFKTLLSGKHQLLISTEIYFEYLEIIGLKSRPENLYYFERFIVESEFVIVTEPSTRWNAIAIDPDDNKFVDCAVAGNADYIITNDAHFNTLANSDPPLVKIITAEKFIQIEQDE